MIKHASTIIMFYILAFCPAVQAAPKSIIGYLENITATSYQLRYLAKIDTGADYSSIYARNVKRIYRHNQAWVRYTLTDDYGSKITFLQPITRIAKIKRKLLPARRRYVVIMSICLSGVLIKGEVNLANRKRYKHQILVGRNMLNGHFLVNPDKKLLGTPRCRGR
jgi:hypothetical protein